MGAHADGGVMWVPGDGTCCWGAITGGGCDEPSTAIAWQEDIVDGYPLPRVGIIAVPVCVEHGVASREWQRVEVRDEWVQLQEDNPARVWLVEALSPVR